MAPAMKSVVTTTSNAENDLARPLEGPVSLLWAYQLRREHALLLTRIDGLTDAVRKEDAAAQIKSLSIDLKAAVGRITAVEKKIDSHSLDLQAIRDKLSAGDDAFAKFQLGVVQSEKQHAQKIESIEAEQKNLKTQNEYLKAAIATASEAKVKEQQNQIRQLQEKTKELEGGLAELTEREVIVVKDSIEDIPPPNFKKPQLVRNSNVSKKMDHSRPKAYSHANDLLQETEEEEDSNLRTLHPFQREETISTDFDLDAGVATMSYARHLRGTRVREESMAMLPELPASETPQAPKIDDEHTDLQQGHAQLWDQYLTQGRDLLRREEDAIVHAFVAGIAHPVLRADCKRWLDERVWSWENVESFPANSKPQAPETSPEPASTAEPTPAPEPIGGLGVSRKGTNSQVVSRELAKLLEDQGRRGVEFLTIARSPEPNGNRRSQRIAKKNDTVIQQANDTQQTGPAKLRSQLPIKTRGEPSKQPRDRRKQAVEDPESPAAEAGERASVQLQPLKPTKATLLKQGVMPIETWSTSVISHTTGAVKPATRTKPDPIENRDLQFENISNRDLREKIRKMHEIFAGEPLRVCHEALVATGGSYEDACRFVVDRTVQWRRLNSKKNAVNPSTKLKSKKNSVQPSTSTSVNGKKDAVHPSTPQRVNGSRNARLMSPLNAAVQRPDPPKTPEDQMRIGRTSYKRKAEISEQEQVANMKRARLRDKKRGPPPPIPILPWSNTDSD